MGGTWSRSPVSVAAARATSSLVTPAMSKVPVTSPVASSVDVVDPSSSVPS